MTKSELINEILSEWAYRVDDGQPNPNNQKHLAELSIVLSEMGLSEIKYELFENLKEAESKQFSNPILNKVIKYKNEKGEDKEAPVGNLLRLPQGHPGREAAEKMIPADGTPERDAMNKSLGGEKDGKSTEPASGEKPKDGEAPAAGGGEEEKAKAAQAMFEPKADPAMAARMDREKAANAKLAQKDKEDAAENEKDVKPDTKADDTFNPIEAQDVQLEMPKADPDTFGGGSDIPDGIPNNDLEKFNTDINKVAKIVQRAKAKGEKAPDINLCDVTIPGTNLYCDDNLGIPRDKMPQFKGKAVPGSRAADMPLDKDGEVDTEPVFKKMLEEKGIKTLQTEVPADKLKATQSELGGDKVVGMMGALEKDPHHPSITAPIYVSRDGFVIDGHHRWAAIVAYNAQNPDNQIPMKTTVIDMDIKDAIPMCNKFAKDMGIAAKKQGETTGKAAEQPTSAPNGKTSNVAKKAIDRIKDGVKKFKEDETEFFNKKVHKGNSPERRSFGEAFKHKAKGAWEAIKHGAEHEVHLFKEAGSGVKNFFSGGKVSDEEKKALIGVAKKVAIAAAFGAAGGGLAHGAVAFGKHVMMEFIPHVVAETVAMGAGKAALFAGEEDNDADMMKFMEIISKKLESEDIPDEIMADAVESYNQNKVEQSKEKTENEMKYEAIIKASVDQLLIEILDEAPQSGDPKLAARSKETGKVVYFKTPQAKKAALQKGTHEDPKKKATSNKPQAATQNMFTSDPSYQKRLGKEKPAVSKSTTKPKPTPTAVKPAKGARIIGGKDKTLAKVDTLKSKEFTQKQQPDGAVFAEKNKAYSIPPPYKLPKELFQNTKVPTRHLIALERMMNTKATAQTAKWSHFSDLPGGAGQISAQAGELMTMVSTTLDDKQAAAFFNSLLEHEKQQIAANPNLKSEGSRVVGNSWIKAAVNNRRAIRNRLSKEYPGCTIEAGSWDTQGEVEAMGLNDYKKNKGFSTDAYFKIKTKDGKEILDEVSLKKSTAVNFLNSGTGKLFDWDPNIPDDINPNVYQKNQRKSLSEFGSANVKKLQAAVASDAEFQSIVKSKKIDLPSALAKLQAGKGSRDINKVVLSAITVLAKKGDKGALKYLQGVQDTHKAHQKAIISALGTNPKLKQGMLTAIREEFPLKAVGEGEESMAIGPNSLDRAVLKDIFQTSDFDEIKQGLFAVTDEEPPYLAYKAGKKGRVIPIATIVAREDGVGYGGQIKFEMQLDKRFAKILEQANKNVYGG